jgi:hypothetical protein
MRRLAECSISSEAEVKKKGMKAWIFVDGINDGGADVNRVVSR